MWQMRRQEELSVVFGTVRLDGVAGWLGVHHWALKVGKVWREVGPGPDSNDGHIVADSDPLRKNIVGEYEIKTTKGVMAASGAVPTSPADFWLTSHLLPAVLTAVIVGFVAWVMGFLIYWCAFLTPIMLLVTLLPGLEYIGKQVSRRLGEWGTVGACGAGGILIMLFLGGGGMFVIFCLLSVWFLWRVWWPKQLDAWKVGGANR